MKTLFISFFISLQFFAFSQITLESTYTGSAGFSQIKENVFRFYNYNIESSQCLVYDEQHQQVKAINLGLTADQYLSSITYVSEDLFDLDEKLELLFTFSEWFLVDTTWYLSYNSKIINENGVLLLDIPGAQYNSITNINLGAELLSWIYDYSLSSYPIETLVYHVPGGYSDVEVKQLKEEITAWPNPCSQQIFLPINGNSNSIKIYNEQGMLVDEINSSNTESTVKYSVNHLSSGLYFYQSVSNQTEGKMHKFIIQ